MTWMDEGFEEELREVKVSDDLYILVSGEYIDLHSRQLDEEIEPGVLVSLEEIDELIEALMQLRKELE